MKAPADKITLAEATYANVLKSAIRQAGVFLAARKQHYFLVVARLPEDADVATWFAAASHLMNDFAALKAFEVSLPPRRGRRTSVSFVELDIRSDKSILLLWPADLLMPGELHASADRIVELGPVKPAHLEAAFRRVRGEALSTSNARELLRFPATYVFASLRPGRPIASAIESLRTTLTTSSSRPVGPSLGDLEGYGKSKEWGLDLARDLASWTRGEIEWSDVDKGILISGPPGCGKTLFASALARTCDVEIVATSVGRWLAAGYLNSVLAAMRKSFAEAIARRPCILFLDELDGIGDRATLRGDHVEYWTQIVNTLLELIDGYERLEGVVVVGATNNPEKIDRALRRAGRLDRHVAIERPDRAARRSLSLRYLGGDLTDAELDRVVASTEGMTGADFEQAGREVRRKARRIGSKVSANLVLSAFPPRLKISGARRRTVAVHEAGHAVVGVYLGVGKLDQVIVHDEVRGGAAAGFTHFVLDGEKERDRETFLSHIAMLLAGRLAEEVILGTAFEGSGGEGSDIQKATDIATFIDVQLAMLETLGYFSATSSADLEALRRDVPSVRERAEKVLLAQWKRARKIVEQCEEIIERLAEKLEAEGRVSGEEVEALMAAGRRSGS